MTTDPTPTLADPTAPAANGPPALRHARGGDRDLADTMRRLALFVAAAFLTLSLAIAYYSANSIVSIWFEYQYTPIVRLVMALGIAATAAWVILRLTRRTA